jgi:hypothetical protein
VTTWFATAQAISYQGKKNYRLVTITPVSQRLEKHGFVNFWTNKIQFMKEIMQSLDSLWLPKLSTKRFAKM